MKLTKETTAFPLQLSYQRLSNIDPVEARKELLKPYQNGMVERSHRTDDEEFYLPYLAKN